MAAKTHKRHKKEDSRSPEWRLGFVNCTFWAFRVLLRPFSCSESRFGLPRLPGLGISALSLSEPAGVGDALSRRAVGRSRLVARLRRHVVCVVPHGRDPPGGHVRRTL